MDPENEKANALPRAGSFYYQNVKESQRPELHRMAHLTFQSDVFRQFSNAGEAVLSGGYFPGNFKVIHFTDKDIIYHGVERALQKRENSNVPEEATNNRADNLTIDNHFFPGIVNDVGAGVDFKLVAFPGDYGNIVLAEDTRLVFGLKISPDLLITSISLGDGRVLLSGQDFASEFGKLHFYENPIALFDKMKFMARSYIERSRNLYSYSLRLDDVYGPADRVLKYYKETQSVKAFYLAAAQAAGFPVTRNECTILRVTPLLEGVSYHTTDGIYDAPFPHTHYLSGTKLSADHVIAGSELFQILGPESPLPDNIDGVYLNGSCIANGLFVPNQDIILSKGGIFQPAYEGDTSVVNAYHKYLYQRSSLKKEAASNFLFPPDDPAQGLGTQTLVLSGTSSLTGPGGLSALDPSFSIMGANDDGNSSPSTGDWTLSLWFAVHELTTNGIVLRKSGGNSFWSITVQPNGPSLGFSWKDASVNESENYLLTQFTPDSWHHMVVVRDSGANKLLVYFDGANVLTAAVNGTGDCSPTGPLESDTSSFTASAGMQLANLAFYKKALNSDDISTLWNSGNGVPASDAMLPRLPEVVGNGLNNLLQEIVPHKYIIVRINEHAMTRRMRNSLHAFIKREAPLGSVLLFAPLNAILLEERPEGTI